MKYKLITHQKSRWYMSENSMQIFSMQLKLVSSTQVISIVEQVVHMKHWLFCNIINACWQSSWSRWLWSALTARIEQSPEIELSICITAHRNERLCRHLRDRTDCYIFIFNLHKMRCVSDEDILVGLSVRVSTLTVALSKQNAVRWWKRKTVTWCWVNVFPALSCDAFCCGVKCSKGVVSSNDHTLHIL